MESRSSIQYIRSGLKEHTVRTIKQSTKARTSLPQPPPTLVGKSIISGSLLLGCITGKCIYVFNNKALCESPDSSSRVLSEKDPKTVEPKFDWNKFWELLKPHWWYLVIAITVSIYRFPN